MAALTLTQKQARALAALLGNRKAVYMLAVAGLTREEIADLQAQASAAAAAPATVVEMVIPMAKITQIRRSR